MLDRDHTVLRFVCWFWFAFQPIHKSLWKFANISLSVFGVRMLYDLERDLDKKMIDNGKRAHSSILRDIIST